MSDIAKKLRDMHALAAGSCDPEFNRALLEAAGEIERLRNAIYEVTTNGRWTEGEQRGEWAISIEVYETARDAYDGPSSYDQPLQELADQAPRLQ
jgi:hypothetical protein